MKNPTAILLSLTLFFVCFLTSSIIPPFQSPDEFAHIRRAYLLTKGQIFLKTPEGQSSGGMVDLGLLSYMSPYEHMALNPNSKVDPAQSHDEIEWSGVEQFREAPAYLPLIYAPQAGGLLVGKAMGLSVASSYKLARLSVLIIACLVIYFAFRVYSPSPLIAAFLFIPMSIFQMSSASLDGISTAVSIFVISAFMRMTLDKEKSSPWLLYAMSVGVVLVATTRPHLLTMILLIFGTFFYTRNKKNLIAGSIVAALVILWTGYCLSGVVSKSVALGLPTPNLAIIYIKSPLSFVKVLLATLTDTNYQTFYIKSFFGVLGWLDTRFSNWFYSCLSALFLMLLIFSTSFKGIKTQWPTRALLVSCAIISFFLTFFALLILWTPHPATVILGVQGRYFLVPAMFVAYALDSNQRTRSLVHKSLGVFLLAVLVLFSSFSTRELLLERYYILDGK